MLGRSAPTIASSLDFFGPLLSHNWVARKFKGANTVVASLSTASQLRRRTTVSASSLVHKYTVYVSTQALPSLTSCVTAPRRDAFYKMTTISAFFLDGFYREKKIRYTVQSQEIIGM